MRGFRKCKQSQNTATQNNHTQETTPEILKNFKNLTRVCARNVHVRIRNDSFEPDTISLVRSNKQPIIT